MIRKPSTRRAVAIAAAALAALGCAHMGRPSSPTLAESSEGSSRLVKAFNAAISAKDGAALERICSKDFFLRPATRALPVFTSPSRLRVERFVEAAGAAKENGSAAPVASDTARDEAASVKDRLEGAEARKLLLDRRNRFAGFVRHDARLADVKGSGLRRTILVHMSVAGVQKNLVARMQDESWWRCEAISRPDLAEGWALASAVEERRTLVTVPVPIFSQVYPEEGEPAWKAGTKRPTQAKPMVVPGALDTGGVAVMGDCINGGSCLFVGGGDGLAALSRGRPSEENSYENQVALLGLGGSDGEVKGVLCSDFNNDGMADLFVSYDGSPCRLYRGGRLLEATGLEHMRFEEISQEAGLGGLAGPYRTAIALDADLDGRLDLYIVQYGDTSKTGPAKDGRNGLPNRFFRNVTEQGEAPRFVDESTPSHADDTGWGLAASAADYDGDGRTDIYVANEFGHNVLYRNMTAPGGPVRFEDVTSRTGIEDPGFGAGVAWGDYDLDGDLDLYVSNRWLDERWILTDPRLLNGVAGSPAKKTLQGLLSGSSLYRNDVSTSGRFQRVSEAAGVSDGGWAWGSAWTDIDGDGLQDIVVANGMLTGQGGASHEVEFWNALSAGWNDFSAGKWTIETGAGGITGPQAKRIFLNLGDGTFAEVGYAAGFDTTADLRGLIAADLNGDGAPDILAGAYLDSPVIFENTNEGRPTRIVVRLEGTHSNWDAVGAVVRVTAGGKVQTKEVSAGGSFLSDAGRSLDFGLGTVAANAIEKLEVRWPSGVRSVLDNPQPRRGIILVEEPPKTEGAK